MELHKLRSCSSEGRKVFAYMDTQADEAHDSFRPLAGQGRCELSVCALLDKYKNLASNALISDFARLLETADARGLKNTSAYSLLPLVHYNAYLVDTPFRISQLRRLSMIDETRGSGVKQQLRTVRFFYDEYHHNSLPEES